MADANSEDVPRTPEEPTAETILDELAECEPYTVGELTERFDASRWTIQRRLDSLVDRGEVRKKKHGENRVSYWVEDSEL